MPINIGCSSYCGVSHPVATVQLSNIVASDTTSGPPHRLIHALRWCRERERRRARERLSILLPARPSRRGGVGGGAAGGGGAL